MSLWIFLEYYEMFLTMQLIYLTCTKDLEQSPTRKEGWDVSQRTSDDSLVRRFSPINIHDDEPEAPKVRDTLKKERAS